MATLLRTADVLNSVGVDTHIPYTDGGYANLGTVLADLRYLGLTHVRDGLSDGAYGSAPLASFVALAQAGISFTTVVGGGVTTSADIANEMTLLDRLATAVPGSITAVEGPNEINNQPLTFNGVSGQAGAVALQRTLYAAVHADPVLAGVGVDYFTGYSGSSAGNPDPSQTPGLADYDTQHPYPRFGEAPGPWIDPATVLDNEGASKGPFVYTETGYSTVGTDPSVVSESVQAKYTLDLLLDAVKDGASHIYLYELMDAYAPGSPQGDDGFGLFGQGNAPKPAAVAIHNLTTILADHGATASSFTPAGFTYAIDDLPATGASLAMAKSNGVVDIAVWAEPQIWDPASHTEVAAATSTATLVLGSTYAKVSVYDPLSGSTPIEVLHHVSTLALSLTDHPLIVKLSAAKDGTGTLALTGLSGGKAVAGSTVVAALSDPAGIPTHVTYTFTDTTANTTLATGPSSSYAVPASLVGHTISVTAAYADAQGRAALAQTAAMVARTPVGADTLVLNLAEDAYLGDAQFTVSVDGVQLGAARSVTALHATGKTQAFTFQGSFGPGLHAVAIDFLNDAYAGTVTTDRNLYVGSIVLNGRATTENAAQLGSGAVTYAVQSPAVTSTPAPVKASAVPVQASTTTSPAAVPVAAASAVRSILATGTPAATGTIGAGTTLILDPVAAKAIPGVRFTGAGAALQLADAPSFQGTIAGFGQGDTMDLRSIAFAGQTTLAYDGRPTAGTLSVSDGVHTARLAMLGQYGLGNFQTSADGHGGTAIGFAAAPSVADAAVLKSLVG